MIEFRESYAGTPNKFARQLCKFYALDFLNKMDITDKVKVTIEFNNNSVEVVAKKLEGVNA